MKNYPIVLTIAGSDSSGGAGIQADIKSIEATGSYASSVITAVTAQNTQGVRGVQSISGDFVFQQMQAVFADLDVKAVKIGMLFNKEIILAVKSGLEKFRPKNVVLDPVMISKSGYALLQQDIVPHLQALFAYVDLLTPNIPEIEKLLNVAITDQSSMEQAAAQLSLQFKTNVLLKGGHLLNLDKAPDLLYHYEDKKSYWYDAKRVATQHTHGTGCTLSSAIASYLAQEYPLRESISLAKDYLHQAIKAGAHLQIGKGVGPVDHFFRLKPPRVLPRSFQ